MKARNSRDPTAEAKLSAFVAELRDDMNAAHPSLSPECSSYVATAIDAFLRGDAPTLDHAFGLVKSGGRPAGSATPAIVKLAHLLDSRRRQLPPQTWDSLAAEFNRSKQDLIGIWKRHCREPRERERVAEIAGRIARGLASKQRLGRHKAQRLNRG